MSAPATHPSLLSPSELEKALLTHCETGLTEVDAAHRLKQYGKNELPQKKGPHPVQLFLHQFRSPLIYLLLIAAVITTLLGEQNDALVMMLVVSVNSLIGFFQESRAEKKMKALEKYLAPMAKVIREGTQHKIPAAELTIGDVVLLEAGDRVPADGRLLSANQLECDEASFTGESLPASKRTEKLTQPSLISEQHNMVFMGSLVVNGTGKCLVTGVGSGTELGRISGLLTTTAETTSPLEKTVQQLSRQVLLTIAVLIALIMIGGVLTHHPLKEMFEIGVSLAVSAIPEGLPVVVTITLSLGVWKMAREKSIVRRLDAVETLGSVDIICTDKTGTLTRGEMMVNEIFTQEERITVEGKGYMPEGRFLVEKHQLDAVKDGELHFIGTLALLSSNGRIEKNDSGVYQALGDPTEVAVYVLGRKTHQKMQDLEEKYEEVFALPFDQKKRLSAKVYKQGNSFITVVKGSPESVVSLVRDHHWVLESAQNAAQRGNRVITLAYARTRFNPVPTLKNERFPQLKIVGNLSMSDPIRSDTPTAINQAQKSGIQVLMITGDHSMTAKHIGEQIGLRTQHILTGPDAVAQSDLELTANLQRTSIIARATPDLKMRLVQLLQRQHKVVAMTGDGVNDAPALKQADVGIAMGKTGSDVAIGAADIILTDDNFSSIVKAIELGRVIWQNLRKVIFYLFSSSVGEIMVIAGSLVLQLPLPLLAPQILWLNLVTDGFLDVALANEEAEEDVMTSHPRDKKLKMLDLHLLIRLLFTGGWMMVIGLAFFVQELPVGLDKARTMVLLNLAAIQWFNAWNARSETQTVFEMNPFHNRALLVSLGCCVALQYLAIHWGPLQTLMRTVPLTPAEWLMSITVASTILFVDVIWKKVIRQAIK